VRNNHKTSQSGLREGETEREEGQMQKDWVEKGGGAAEKLEDGKEINTKDNQD